MDTILSIAILIIIGVIVLVIYKYDKIKHPAFNKHVYLSGAHKKLKNTSPMEYGYTQQTTSPQMIKCPKCNILVTNNDMFCSNCGQKL